MSARYQIFISSTLNDLTEERQAVFEAIREMGHIPAGMEIFPAANFSPSELIGRIIKQSDYYVLIIGGRYGSVREDGISYTEKEYDLAEKLGIPVLVFIHKAPENITLGKSETKKSTRGKLQSFKKKVGKHHLKYWTSPSELKSHVIVGLTQAFTDTPRKGWVRAEGFNDKELLLKLTLLQERFDKLQGDHDTLKARYVSENAPLNAAQGQEILELTALNSSLTTVSVTTCWDEVFFLLSPELTSPVKKESLKRSLDIFVSWKNENPGKILGIDTVTIDVAKVGLGLPITEFDKIMRQFLALELVEQLHVPQTTSSSGASSTRWKLSAKGQRKYLSSSIVPSKAGPQA